MELLQTIDFLVLSHVCKYSQKQKTNSFANIEKP